VNRLHKIATTVDRETTRLIRGHASASIRVRLWTPP
jgi:hypothetical protein